MLIGGSVVNASHGDCLSITSRPIHHSVWRNFPPAICARLDKRTSLLAPSLPSEEILKLFPSFVRTPCAGAKITQLTARSEKAKISRGVSVFISADSAIQGQRR